MKDGGTVNDLHGTGSAKALSRREMLRRSVIFSTGALAARPLGKLAAAAEGFAEGGMHLLAFGDYGTKGNGDQIAVARAMEAFAQKLGKPLSAVLALGDNFYRYLTPDRFDKHFEKMYSAEILNCPFYACAGNHDYGTAMYDYQPGKLQMQMDYAKNNPQSRWKFPAKWYALELPSAEKPLVKIITLDGSYWEGALTPKEKLEQRRFLDAELAKETKAPWLWLVNHYPLFSDSTHGDAQPLIREWGPILQKHPVSLCLAGHDHTLQHLKVEGYDCSFLVSGAGGQRLYKIKGENRGFAQGRHFGFCHIHVTADELNAQFVNTDGKQLHAFKRQRDGQMKVLSAA
jgi:3',5'-cyclic AMP phosphodiesterase CpdA